MPSGSKSFRCLGDMTVDSEFTHWSFAGEEDSRARDWTNFNLRWRNEAITFFGRNSNQTILVSEQPILICRWKYLWNFHLCSQFQSLGCHLFRLSTSAKDKQVLKTHLNLTDDIVLSLQVVELTGPNTIGDTWNSPWFQLIVESPVCSFLLSQHLVVTLTL